MTVFAFDHPHQQAPRDLTALLGGKGAGLAEMTSVLGLPVPPGFTIAVPVGARYRTEGWPADLDDVLRRHCRDLEQRLGRRFGDASDPLLVAVRSGAPRSMPGMLDTVLNLGLNDTTVEGLAAASGDPRFAWDSYLRFVTMYATTVLGVDLSAVGTTGHRDVEGLRAAVDDVCAAVKRLGAAIPADPAEQLRGAIEAVLRSWDGERARVYRERENIAGDLGTAVSVQAMVFGNYDDRSGTGVVFTRDPATGENRPYGDFLPRAQGEDVVSGRVRPLGLDDMRALLPGAHRELVDHLAVLESHYRDMCDVEFTVERGRLWILQTRVGKRGAVAAVRIAAAMINDRHIGLSLDEARARVSPEVRERARHEVLASVIDTHTAALATGLAASPGRATGQVVLTADAAADATGPVILVRPETSPQDVHGMSVAEGILTLQGGLVSHAAVVARGWNLPAVVGAETLTIDGATVRDADGRALFTEGDVITIDGSTGAVWRGDVAPRESTRSPDDILAEELPELALLDGTE